MDQDLGDSVIDIRRDASSSSLPDHPDAEAAMHHPASRFSSQSSFHDEPNHDYDDSTFSHSKARTPSLGADKLPPTFRNQSPPPKSVWGRVQRPFSQQRRKDSPSPHPEEKVPKTRAQQFAALARRALHFLYEQIFGGRVFCCCIPTRAGVIVGSCVQFLVAGALAIILWFEVSTQHDFTFDHFDKVMFTCAGILETVLFAAAVLGFIGAIVRKQLFVTMYCVFLYVHFLANFGVACWVTWKINHVTDTDIRDACVGGIKSSQGQDQCTHLFSDSSNVIITIIWIIIVVELYGVLIVTRYVRQLRAEKRHGRQTYHRLEEGSMKAKGAKGMRTRSRSGSRSLILLEGRLQDRQVKTPECTPFGKSPAATFFPLTPSGMPGSATPNSAPPAYSSPYGDKEQLGDYKAPLHGYGEEEEEFEKSGAFAGGSREAVV